MITIIQRVTAASVTVNAAIIGQIEQGILSLICVEPADTQKQADRLLERILNYRIFSDAQGKMNLGLRDINGGLLLVPQFTLAANTDKGNRPSFTSAATPEYGQQMFEYLRQKALELHPNPQFGQFGADMQVALINDGPVTFTLTSR